MSSSGTEVVANVIAPLIGMLIANFMWLTPLPVVLEARYTRNIGSINPYPFVITILNCVGWIIYGCLTQDFFVFFSNIFGMSLGLYYTIISLTILAKKKTDSDFTDLYLRLESLLIFAFFFWSLMGLVGGTSFYIFSNPIVQAANLVGNVSCAFAIAYYAAPLATMSEVLAKRDSSSLYLPMISINLVNGVMWTVYGFVGKNDINIWGPNLIGSILAICQICLCFLYPAKEKKQGGQSFAQILLLLQGKVPATPTNSAKIMTGSNNQTSMPLSSQADQYEEDDNLI